MSETEHAAPVPAEPLPAGQEAIPQTASDMPMAVTPVPEPGDTIANPAEPLAPTKISEPAQASTFIQKMEAWAGYPKMKYHPVHGGVQVNNPNEEAGLLPATDWKDSPELADASRTWTEAHMASAHNTREKLAAHDEAGQGIVRNSVQADEAVRKGMPQPL